MPIGKKTSRKQTKPKQIDNDQNTQPLGKAGKVKTLPRQPCKEYGLEELKIEIGLAPLPKERARTFVDQRALMQAFVRSGGETRKFAALINSGEGAIMRTVTPENTRNFEGAISLIAQRALIESGFKPFSGPVEMEIDFRFEGNPDYWPTSQADGDLDNLEKAVLDGLKPVWVDDRLVVRKSSIKRCSDKPGISVWVRYAKLIKTSALF